MGNSKNIDKVTIAEDIIKSFHEQFAQNQNHHQKLFLQILAVLLTVIVGFGYIYIRIEAKDKNEVNITVETIYLFLSLSLFLLSLAIALLSNMALGFRRDQLVASNMRAKVGILKNPQKNDGYFITSFNPVGKTRFLLWMPEFHLIFFLFLIIIKIILFTGVILNNSCRLELSPCSNLLLTLSMILALLSYIFDFLISIVYWEKWKNYSDNAPDILKGWKYMK